MTERQIPLFDIQLTPADLAAVEDTLRSGWLTMGPRTQEFEDRFAEHLGVGDAIALSSCTAALHLAYLAAGVAPGDEVIVPGITFVATAAAARYCEAIPVLADVKGPHDLSIDPGDVERRITARTKAVCVVHYGGYAGPVKELGALCEAHGMALIEDAAHSPSASPADGGRKLGGWGIAGCFSFFSNKVLSCGEGGLLATDDEEVAAAVRSLRSHAMTSGTWDRHRGNSLSYDVTGLGYNYRLDEPRAALLISRLAGLEQDIAKRRALVRRYRDLLADTDGLHVPYADPEVETSSCYIMPLLLENEQLREPLRRFMRDRRGIQTSVLYPSVSEFSAYRDETRGPLPRSERVGRTQVTIPLYPLMTESDQDRVVEAITDGLLELRQGARAGQSVK
jgi:dTDP-4-amino-4,6-dideoxygalactose transaminase